jgi:hypothetical protein
MYGFQISEFIIVGVNTHAEEESSVSSIDNFVIPELRSFSAEGLGSNI